MKPFLKWPGSKFKIIDEITRTLPEGSRLIEPFSGSASVCLNTNYPRYTLADNNPDLINLYKTLKKEKSEFVEFCRTFFSKRNNTKSRYYTLREHFNSCDDIAEKSAIFLYLNRHAYNGLCRYNLSGDFNAPYGYYKKPYFPEEEMALFIEKSRQCAFTHSDFKHSMKKAKPGDVIYCDPPYVPLSKSANFTAYSQGNFGEKEQTELAELAHTLSKKGVHVVISNHATPYTQKLYQQAKIKKFHVQRFISCKADSRVKVLELLAIYEAN